MKPEYVYILVHVTSLGGDMKLLEAYYNLKTAKVRKKQYWKHIEKKYKWRTKLRFSYPESVYIVKMPILDYRSDSTLWIRKQEKI
jgi:hypothetical protein